MNEKPPTATQLRGDIDQGRSGAKAEGLDPAAAPMETDAEAGGTPPTAAEVAIARRHETRPSDPTPYAVAPERTPDGAHEKNEIRYPVLVALFWAVVAALLFVALQR
jgi:hypothetical protein